MGNRGVRIRGALLIVLGAALSIGIAWLLGEMAPAMQPGGSPSGTRFTGSADEGRLITQVLTGIIAVGVVFSLYGIFMLVTGKESRIMKIVGVVLLIALIVGALLTGETVRLGPLLQLLGR